MPPPGLRPLCPIADLPPGSERGFTEEEAGGPLFAIGTEAGPVVFRNACPHLGVPLDWRPGRFLSADGSRIICATHGAEFRIADGLCLRGPCRGEHLTALRPIILDGVLMVQTDPAT